MPPAVCFTVGRLDIDFEKQLNPDQLAAVTSPCDRPALVLAGAGSGKTRTLTYRVAWLISECGLSPREIMLLTFTNKAANQMLERIYQLTGRAPSEFWGGTFHSIGNRFLRIEAQAAGLSPNFTILDSEDSERLLKEAVTDIFPNYFADKDNPKAKLLREIISYARNTRLEIRDAMAERFAWLESPYSDIEEIAEYYADKKRAANACDFDDLLELWYNLLRDNPEILQKYSSRFKNILVDEYQDTNKLQSDILDLLASHGRISAVGDDAQCIYSWRGAEIENILDFRERYPAAHIYKIERNYRSTPQILKFANSILAEMDSDEAYRKTLVPAREGYEKPYIIRAMDSVSQAKRVCDAISELVAAERCSYSDIAVLYRSHFQAMDMQLQLQQRTIPFAMTSGLKFFEQAHVKDVIAQIKFAANPKDSVSFGRFMKFLPKVGEKTVKKIFFRMEEVAKKRKIGEVEALAHPDTVSKVPTSARKMFEEVAADILKISKMLENMRKNADASGAGQGGAQAEQPQRATQADFFEQMLGGQPHSQEEKSERPAASAAAAATAENEVAAVSTPQDAIKLACSGWYVSAMKTVYEDWEDRCQDFDSLYEYASRFSDFEDFLANVTLEISEAETGNNGESADRVRLMTVHQAKGLEFPVVFLISAADGLFPTKRSIDEGDVEEERRLFYVAATRAMDYLVISYPRVSVIAGNYEMREPSRFLAGVDPSLYVVEGL